MRSRYSAFALGVGGEFRAPMAVAVIAGLIVSTLLSLVFVPAVFLLAFGASTLDHELRVHVRELADRNAAIDEISREIDRRFRTNGIEIAYNQVDVHLRSVPAGREARLQTLTPPVAD